MKQAGTIRISQLDNIVLVTIDRVGKLNSWTTSMRSLLLGFLEGMKADSSSRPKAVAITGAGEAFCAGADVDEVRAGGSEAAAESIRQFGALFTALRELPVPIVAAVRGVAVGSGLQLALSCDWIVTHEEARLGFPDA